MTNALAPTNVSDINTWACPDGKLVLAADKVHTPEWYALRRTGIGGSELAGIYGESPFSDATPWGVWLNKIEERELEESPAMHWGTVLEDAIARDWAVERGLTIRNVGTYQSRSHAHALANPDRLTNDGGGLEIKTTNAFTKAWADGATPRHVELQADWCMAVTGRSHWWIACLIGGQRLEVRHRERDSDALAGHLDFVEGWWTKHVIDFEPPEIGKPVELEPIDTSLIVDAPLPEAVLSDYARWAEIAQQTKDLAEELAEIKARFALELGAGKRLRASGIDIAQWIERKGSNKFLRARFKKDHPVLEAEYSEVGPPTRYVARVGGNDE